MTSRPFVYLLFATLFGVSCIAYGIIHKHPDKKYPMSDRQIFQKIDTMHIEAEENFAAFKAMINIDDKIDANTAMYYLYMGQRMALDRVLELYKNKQPGNE